MNKLLVTLFLAMLGLESACTAANPQVPPLLTPTASGSLITNTPSPTNLPSRQAEASPLPTTTQMPSPEIGLTSLRLEEVPVTVTFPNNYVLNKSIATNRRGSFVSYVFIPPDYQTPYLYEIQFFSAESIQEFTKDCLGKSPCFFGDFPDLDRYYGQLKAYAELKEFQNYELRHIGERYYFVSSHPCAGDSCVIREYTTFIPGEIKVDVWILMEDESQVAQSDDLFLLFQLQE